MGLSVSEVLWSVVMRSELTWCMFWSEVKWSEMKWSELRWSSWGQTYSVHLGDLLLRVLDCIVTISFGVYLVLCLCFVICECVYVGVFWQLCGCFGNMCTCSCIYCVLYCLYCVFVLFRLCIFILCVLFFNFVSYLFLFLFLCIIIVMYVMFCIFCFLRANCHSSATLTEVLPCFYLSCKANARV
jgi:hypothetical protein